MIRFPLVGRQRRRESQVKTLHECDGVTHCRPPVAIDTSQHLLAVRVVERCNGFIQVFEEHLGLNEIVFLRGWNRRLERIPQGLDSLLEAI